MRRICTLLLSLLLLCGCAATRPEAVSAESDWENWSSFYISCCYLSAPTSVTLDNEVFSGTIRYDGQTLTAEDKNGTRSYSHLVYSLLDCPEAQGYNLLETFILTAPVQAYGTTFDKIFWETTIDTAGLKAGNYTLKISALDAPVTATEEIELLDKGTVPTATQTPGFGCGILAIAFGTAVVLGTLRRK